MSKPLVTFFETNTFQEKYLTLKLQKDFDLNFIPEPLTLDNVSTVKNSIAIGVFINSHVTPEIIAKLPDVGLITTMSTGFDHVDLTSSKEKNIVVSNVPHYGENTVAEHTLALILAISRRIIPSNKRVREGKFSPQGLIGFDLKGKTLGVVGCGSIGSHVIKMAAGFEMNLLGFDVYKNEELTKNFGIKFVELDELYKNSDVITFHAPYNKHTHHLLNKENIKNVKKGTVIINTSRGGLIETDALYDGLQSGQIKAAGLDVLEEENFLVEEAELLYKDTHISEDLKTVVTNHVLINHPNVVVTPHNAFNSKEAIQRILDTTVENITGFVNSKPINKVL